MEAHWNLSISSAWVLEHMCVDLWGPYLKASWVASQVIF